MLSTYLSKKGDTVTCTSAEENLRRETAEETGIQSLKISEYLGEVPGAKEGDKVHVFACVT
ncbi:NUDIX hydrolase, partial [bacterium]|nr:NUDIX hydrolase [bacterium]